MHNNDVLNESLFGADITDDSDSNSSLETNLTKRLLCLDCSVLLLDALDWSRVLSSRSRKITIAYNVHLCRSGRTFKGVVYSRSHKSVKRTH